MADPKPFERYDRRLVALLDKAVEGPVIIRRKFRTYEEVVDFRQMLYQMRYSARRKKPPVKKRWDKLKFRISPFNDLILAARDDRQGLEDILSDIEIDLDTLVDS